MFATPITTIVPYADGFLVGGNLEVIDGVPVAGLASWNGEEWQEVGGGVRQQADPGFSLSGGHVADVVVDDAGRLHVGGWFTHVGDRTSTNYAIYSPSGPVVRVDDPIDGESPAAPATARLRAVPNPFNPSTEIHFELERVSGATLDLFDASGRRIRSFDLGNRRPGQGSVTWDGTDASGRGVASGTYFARLRTSGRTVGTVRSVLVE